MLIDAVPMALYGKTPCGRKKDDLINHYCDESLIELWVEGCTIQRKKKRGRGEILRFQVDGGPWIQGDYYATQAELEKVIGITFETFCNTLYLTRNSSTTKFLDASPAERAKVLEELVNDSIFQKAGDLVLADLKVKEEERTQALHALTYIKDQLIQYKEDSIKLNQQLAQFTEADNIRKQRVKRKMIELKERAATEQAKLANPPQGDIKELQSVKVQLQNAVQDKQQRIGALQHMLSKTDHSLEEGTTCPTCMREMDEDAAVQLHEFMDSAAEEVEILKREIETDRLTIADINREQDEIRSWVHTQHTVNEALDNIQYELQLLQDDLLPSDTTHLRNLIDENKDRQKNLMHQQENAEQKILAIAEDIPVLKDLRKAFTSEIRNMMFDRIRGSLEYYTNMYLKLLSGNEFRVHFPQQSATGKEKFDIVLSSGGKTQILEGFSEGERWRATFTILLALRRVLLEGRHCKAQWLFVDDAIGVLDDAGIKMLTEVLQGLSYRGGIPQIICTVPRDIEFPQDARVVTVRRLNRISTLEE